MLLPWTTLQPSSRARYWRRAGLAIALAAAAALLLAAFASRPFSPTLALAGVAAALAAWVSSRRRTAGPFEIGVSSMGEIKLRERDRPDGDALIAVPARVAFASPWLISLRRGTISVAIWPDSLPQSTYRQLWVHLRWGRAMPSDQRRAVAANRADSVDR